MSEASLLFSDPFPCEPVDRWLRQDRGRVSALRYGLPGLHGQGALRLSRIRRVLHDSATGQTLQKG